MSVCVKNEIGALKKVLLKRPGMELEHLSPSTMSELLFDDIPYLYGAQKEHDAFAQILRDNGAAVVYLDDLVVESLAQDPSLQQAFIGDVIRQAGSMARGYRTELMRYLGAMTDLRALVLKTMSGVTFEEISGNNGSLPALSQPAARFIVQPMPNLYFTRDPFACVGNGVSLNHMHTRTRNRETIFGHYILHHHPDYAGKVPLYYTPDLNFTIEGGDILNLSERVLAVGISERTQAEGVELLARNIFADGRAAIDTVLAFAIPQTRAFMHLDTVFTQVDRDIFTVHPGILDTLRIFKLTPRGRDGVHVVELDAPLAQVLETHLGLDRVTLLPCGGGSQVASEREQWNDGSNTLCIMPGTVVVYDRNYVTNNLLEEAGVRVIKLTSAELSRGRGGPRCMSMPLLRETV